jgi:cytoskeletal protein CcmA (bactofilin family)
LIIGGRVKGTIHANRVKLNGSAIVEGDIFHRSLSIDENARFEGSSRREETVIDVPRIPFNRPEAQAHLDTSWWVSLTFELVRWRSKCGGNGSRDG